MTKRRKSDRPFCAFEGCYRQASFYYDGTMICPHHARVVNREQAEVAAAHRAGLSMLAWVVSAVLVIFLVGFAIGLARSHGAI